MNPNQILIDSGWKFVMSVSGGGQDVIGGLTRYGGMSGTLLEANVPYSVPAFHGLVGGKVDKIVSPAAARAAAMACYERALAYAPGERVFGFASTGAVARVGGEREGREHQVYMAFHDADRTVGINIAYSPGRERLEEEELTARCIREALAWGCHQFGDVSRQLTDEDDVAVESWVAEPWVSDIVNGRIGVYRRSPVGEVRAIFSSSCNPLHDGHLGIIRDAETRLGWPVDIELCVRNADKPPLDYLTIHERMGAVESLIASDDTVGKLILTNRPLFFDKMRLFPGVTFVVGIDTYDRIMDFSYYPEDGCRLAKGLMDAIRMENRILVYPRKGYRPTERNPELITEMMAKEIVTFVSPDDGYTESDVSSTAIRSSASAES